MSAPDFGVGSAANVSAAGIIGIFKEIYRHVRYVFIHKKNVEKFEEKMKLLIAKRESVQQEVDAAERNLEKIKPDVKHWCERVDKTIDEEVKKVKDLEDKAKAKCFLGLCPIIKSRYQVSRKAEEDVAVVDQHLGVEFPRVADPVVPEALISAAPKNFTAFDSRKVVFDKIVEALKDPTLSMIGVYGTGGVGKTTLVNEVARHVKEIDLFCPVVVVTVTLTPDIKNIQETIAASLGLKLQEDGESVREHKLRERLEKETKILIVLDDIWRGSEVKQVGIPFGDQYKGCKILLTSRDRHLLTNEMDVRTTFPMDALKEKEAKNLFQKIAEINDFENSELQSVATDIVKRCAGLPLAIVTVATTLRNRELAEWRDALLQLQRPSPENFTGILGAAYLAVQLSYNNLASDQIKQTFLLSCLLGNNARIQDLLRCAMGLRLFDGVYTVAETLDRVKSMINKLKASCLLLNGYNDDHLVMHDLVWDVALAIASNTSNDIHAFALRHGDVFEEWPDEEKMQKFKMICLNFASIKKLPHELDCPQLSLFSMVSRGWNSYVEMPPSFFEKTKDIKVLDLRRMDFSSSPSSVSLPTSLRTLCLRWCKLGDVASLGELKSLEILSLSESNVEMLPVEIGRLKKLRSLDLNACRELKIISPGVLSSLSRLEELFMGEVIVSWNRQGNADLDELKGLSCLTTLDICILDAEIVPKDLFSEKLQRYKILIGVEWQQWEIFPHSRTLKLKVNTSVDHLDHGIKGLLKKTEALYLENLKGVKIVLSQVVNRDNLLHLHHLSIVNASEIQYIVNDDDTVDKIAFHQLRSLQLGNLPQLISFCSKNRSEGSTSSIPQAELPLFGEKIELPCLEDLYLFKIDVVGRIWHKQFSTLENLTSLKITNCDNLKGIFSSSMVKNLMHLKRFHVNGCKQLREIIFGEDIEEDKVTISFPQLSTLWMDHLGHFIGFCSENYNIAFPSLKKLTITNCPKLNGFIYNGSPLSMQALFDEKIELPLLEDLLLSKIKVAGRIWHNQFSTLENLTNLTITACDNLKDILSSSTAKSLAQLKSFEIRGCKHLRGIIFNEDVEEDDNVPISFPSLKKLVIYYCPKLKGFIYKSTIEDSIPLSMQVVFDEKVTFPQLEELKLDGFKNCRKIWNDHFVDDSFSKLKSLSVCNCDSLLNIFPFNMMSERLKNLEILSLSFSDIKVLPEQIGQLTKLRSLDLTGCEELKKIPPGVLSSLSRLEELYMGGVIVPWNREDNAGLDELKELSSLTALNICFLDAEIVPNALVSEKLQRYKILIGVEWKPWHVFEYSRTLKLKVNTSADHLDDGIKALLKKTKALYLHGEGSTSVPQHELPLFGEQIELPCLEDLHLSKIDVVGRIWHKQFSTLEILTSLKITNCDNLKGIFSSSMVKNLMHLKRFHVNGCKQLREIIFGEDIEEDKVTISFPQLSDLWMDHLGHFIGFCSENYNIAFPSLKELWIRDCPKLNGFIYKSTSEDGSPLSMQALFDEKVTFPQLEELQLWDLKNCRKIWSDQFVGDSFSKLESLEVYDCDGLMNIFSFNMRERLQNLVKLEVSDCVLLEEIFEPQILNANELDATTATPSITEKTTTSFVFPKLTSLDFGGLPKLKSFYSKIHTTSWPLLKEMRLSGSDMMETVFASESLSFGELTNQQPLFWVNEVTFPNLEVLELQRIPREIWHGQLRTDVFNKLRVLTLEGFPDTSPNLPNCFIQSLPNLERLVVSDAAFSGNEIDASVTSINELSLVKLPHLTHLWKEEYNLCGAFCKLRSLEVRYCGKLKNLVPSSVLSENLTTLKVSTCHGFVNLMTCSTAKSLVQLTSMSIADCEMIKEIIASECDEVNGGIVFTCLKYLELKSLPSLASFCSRQHSFEFPTLEKVCVVGCPEMKIFSQGDLSTPILQRVQFNENADEGRWEGCLNSTIQWSFAEQVGYREIIKMSLSDSSKWMEIWRSPQGILSFKSLGCLEVDDCSTLRCLFTVSIALDLPQLSSLRVKNCSVMEHIILDNGPDEEVENKIVFPHLRYITLESCADLASFYQGSKILKFPDLWSLEVIDCPKMFAFASTFSREQSTETIDDGGNTSRLSIDAAFFNNMVEFPRLSRLVIKHLGNCKKIWHDHLIDDSFSNLCTLEVQNCDKLLNVFSIKMSRRLWQLEELVVGRCDSLEEIFEPQVLNADELHTETATESIVFTALWRLQLSCLPSLACFCLGKHNFEFPALEKMVVSECPKMKIFCQGDLSTPQLPKVILAEDEDEKIGRWEGKLNTTIQQVYEEMNVQNPEEH